MSIKQLIRLLGIALAALAVLLAVAAWLSISSGYSWGTPEFGAAQGFVAIVWGILVVPLVGTFAPELGGPK